MTSFKLLIGTNPLVSNQRKNSMKRYVATTLPALAFAVTVLLIGCGGKWDASSAAD